MYTRIGWVLFVIWQFVPASMWTRTATPAQTRATKVAEFTDVAQKAGLTAANVFGGKNTSTYILESTGKYHIAGEEVPLARGTCLHLPPYTRHCLENSGSTDMKVLGVFHPSGDPASRA